MPAQPSHSENHQPAEPAPQNRAARRGVKKQVPDQARYLPAAGHARPIQGRRINPVRRTG